VPCKKAFSTSRVNQFLVAAMVRRHLKDVNVNFVVGEKVSQ